MPHGRPSEAVSIGGAVVATPVSIQRMTNESLLTELQSLGLTEYQSKVYVAAVKAGEERPGDLADESGVPQGRIYDVIDGLAELGLLEVRSADRGKIVHAPPPRTVLEELKRHRIESFSETVSSATAALEPLHDETADESGGFVTMAKREGTALRHVRQAIAGAEHWITACIPNGWYTDLAAELEAALDRGVTVRVLFVGSESDLVDRSFPSGLRVRHRSMADTFALADHTYGVYSSKHPTQDRQPYVITQEPNLVLLFQIYGEYVWHASHEIQPADGFPRRYLDPWRAILDLHDHLDGDATYRATVVGRRTDTRTAGEWTGPIVEYAIESPNESDHIRSLPVRASLVVDTAEGPLEVGGWKATTEDVAATGIEVDRE